MNCPVCNKVVVVNPRYPLYVCEDCINKYDTLDINDNPILFQNASMSGGIRALRIIDGKQEEIYSYECYVNKIKCIAQEHRFGGIVIQKINNI
jgi:hypothetical protein